MIRAMSKRAVAVLAALALSCAPTAPKYEIKLPMQQLTVDTNGMRVIVLPDPTTPLVEVDVRYEVGSNEDPAGKAGLAHLVEHLMFQQRTAGPDKPPLFTVIRQITVTYNAFTNWDTTHYMNLARAESLEDLIAIEATRMYTGCQTITEEEFAREREVVRNEIRARAGRPEDQIPYLLLADVYPEGHPYAHMIGGDDEQIASATLEDACKFMEGYYVPSRATLIVAGNTTAVEVKQLVGKYFVNIPGGEPAPRREVPPVTPPHKTFTHELDVDESSVHVAWKLPPRYTEQDGYAQFMIGAVTGWTAREGDEWEFASRVDAEILGGALAPIFVVSVYVHDPDDLDDALDTVKRAARNAHRPFEDGPEFDELHAQLAADLVYGFEDLAARTVQYGEYAQFDPKGAYFGGELARIKAIEGDKIRSFIKSSLDFDEASVVVIKAKKGASRGGARAAVRLAGGGGHGDLGDAGIDPAEAKQQLLAPEGASVLAGVKRFELGNGMKVVLLQTASDLPVMTVKLVFSAGSAHEPAGQAGLADVAAGFLHPPGGDAGIGGELASADPIGRVGAQMQVDVTEDHTTFTVRGLNLYQGVIIKGLERLITAGDYSQDSIERYQKRYRHMLKMPHFGSMMRFQRTFAEALFGAEHPYTLTGVPTEQTIGRIGRDAAMGFKGTHYTARNATLIVAGRFDPAAVESSIKGNFGRWSGGHADQPVATAPAPRSGALAIGVAGPEMPQVQIYIGYPAPAGIDGQHAARLVLADMLGNRMRTVREGLGTSYGVYARLETHLGPGAYVVNGGRGGAQIDAERAGESLIAMREGVEKLRTGEGFDEEFVRARRAVLKQLLGTGTASLELGGKLAFLARYGKANDYYDKLIRYVAALSPAQVKALIELELKPENEVIVVLGTAEQVKQTFQEAGLTMTRFVE